MQRFKLLLFSLFFSNYLPSQIITHQGFTYYKWDDSVDPAWFSTITNVSSDTAYLVTNEDGSFQFQCLSGDTLIFRTIGAEDIFIVARADTSYIVYLESHGHADGYKFEERHNLEFNTDDELLYFGLDYRFSFDSYSKDEYGRKKIHAFTNYFNLGIGYAKNNDEYISSFIQLNNFFYLFRYLPYRWRRLRFLHLHPYSNIGFQFNTRNEKITLRLDVGLYLFRTYLFKGNFALNGNIRYSFNEPSLWQFGIVLTKIRIRGTGWYW